MLKRLIGAIIVKNDWVVQSYGYRAWRPVGRVSVAVENLDRWQVDEILIACIDRSARGVGPHLGLIESLRRLRTTTPITYLGGVRSAGDALALVRAGVDRVAMEALFQDDPAECLRIAEAVGRQAVIRAQAMARRADGGIELIDYRTTAPAGALDLDGIVRCSQAFSELLVIDHRNEGGQGTFDEGLIAPFAGTGLQIICLGGITEKAQVERLFGQPQISAVAVGNLFTRRELAHRSLLDPAKVDAARDVSLGEQTRGAREW